MSGGEAARRNHEAVRPGGFFLSAAHRAPDFALRRTERAAPSREHCPNPIARATIPLVANETLCLTASVSLWGQERL